MFPSVTNNVMKTLLNISVVMQSLRQQRDEYKLKSWDHTNEDLVNNIHFKLQKVS